MPEPEVSPEQVEATIQSRGFIVLMLVAAIAGVVVSLAAWCVLELINQIQRGVYVHLPSDLGYHSGPPLWWSLPVLALAGLIVAFAIERLPGAGGHIPAAGLSTAGGPTLPVDLPGILLAALATIGLGIVLGPEAPLIALGSGLGVLTIRLARRDAPPQVVTVLAAAGTFAAVSFLFQSPLLAAVLMIEVTGLGGPRLTLVLLPGLLAAGIGALVSLGMGSWTGLSTSAYALGPVEGLAKFPRPDIADFGWTIALALAVALACVLIVRGGRRTVDVVAVRRFVLLPVVGLIVAGLAIAFQQATGKPFQEVLFSGQSSLPGLVTKAGAWSIGTLALLIVCKGIAYSLSLGSFRGGPTFPATVPRSRGRPDGRATARLLDNPRHRRGHGRRDRSRAAPAAVGDRDRVRAHRGIRCRLRATGDRRHDRGLHGESQTPYVPRHRRARHGHDGRDRAGHAGLDGVARALAALTEWRPPEPESSRWWTVCCVEVVGVVGAGVVTVVVLVGAVTVVVGVVIVVCWVVVVGCTVVVVVWPMLSDWLVTDGVFLELLSETSTITTTISAMTSAAPPAIAQPLRPPPPSTEAEFRHPDRDRRGSARRGASAGRRRDSRGRRAGGVLPGSGGTSPGWS